MMESFKSCAKAVAQGFGSIAEGMATFTLWPATPVRPLPVSRIQVKGMKSDFEALAMDSAALGKDFNRAVEKLLAEHGKKGEPSQRRQDSSTQPDR